MDRFEDCISFLIGNVSQQITRRTREELAAGGVSGAQRRLGEPRD